MHQEIIQFNQKMHKASKHHNTNNVVQVYIENKEAQRQYNTTTNCHSTNVPNVQSYRET